METMTIPTTPWASLPSYAPSFAGSAGCTCDVLGGTLSVFGTGGDAAVATQLGADLVGGADFAPRTIAPRNKDIRPGSRAWSPPV
jgi:hypothetical protein